MSRLYARRKPFVAVIFLQFAFAVMDILNKSALNKGMSNYVYTVYRHAIANIIMAPLAFFLDMTRDDVSDFHESSSLEHFRASHRHQPLHFGNETQTASFAVALINLIPGITFIMACILRIGKINIKSSHSQAKIIGTLSTFAGATVTTLVKGPLIALHAKTRTNDDMASNGVSLHNSITGSLMILVLAVVYSGMICTGLVYYIQGVIMKDQGPVFVTEFALLSTVIVTVMSFFILSEKLILGRVCGAIVIIGGLYLVVLRKSKDYKSMLQFLDENQKAPTIKIIDACNEGTTNAEKQESDEAGHSKDEIACDWMT